MNPSLFAQIPSQPQHISNHHYEWNNTLTLQMGKLVPICCKEVLPGDEWHGRTDIFMRFMPLYAPVMHKVNCFTHFFFVPSRILWNNGPLDSFETFMFKGREGDKNPVPPILNLHYTSDVLDYSSLTATSSLADYLGLNLQHLDFTDEFAWQVDFSLLPFMAYQSICDEWYRNKNLEDSYFNDVYDFHKGGYHTYDEDVASDQHGTMHYSDLFTLHNRGWEADYFTSALPFPQRGDDVTIPFATAQDVGVMLNPSSTNGVSVKSADGSIIKGLGNSSSSSYISAMLGPNDGTSDSVDLVVPNSDGTTWPDVLTDNAPAQIDPLDTLIAQTHFLQNSATIRDLRIATIQDKFQVISANTLPDYKHFISAFFDVTIPDDRLQLPEFVGGGRQSVIFSEVTQTSATEAGSPQGNQAGHGVSPANGQHSFNFRATEHGYLIGIMSVLPRTSYSQGISKMWTRFDSFDYYLPLFETLPMMAVKNKELYVSGIPNTDDADFGYQPQHIDYKFAQNEVHGEMKSSLSYWTLGRLFDQLPSLNTSFVTSDPSTRIFNVDDGEDPDATDKIVASIDFECNVTRHMSVYSTIN